MNNYDYKEAFKDIKPSKQLNERIVDQLLHNRTGNKLLPHKRYKIRLAAICIVLLSITSVSVAASSWNLVDVFKGYFKELVTDNKENPEGRVPKGEDIAAPSTKPVASDSAFLNKAGAILEASDTNAGLQLTARGIVGDDRALYVAIEVATTNGQDFTKEQEDNLNALQFQTVRLQLDDDVLGQYSNCVRIDDGSSKGRATFLVDSIISNNQIDNISGHRLTITLTNFLHTTNDLEDIGMGGNLYDIFTRYEAPAEDDYQYYSVRSNGNHTDAENKILEEYYAERKSGKLTGDAYRTRRNELIQAGLLDPLYTLPETSTRINFSSKYPKLEITNMGIKNNIFTFNVALNGELSYQNLNTKHLTLVNRKTGASTSTIMDIDQWEGDENEKLLSAHFVVFRTISSAEQLKDYYLAIGGDGAKDIINEGEWKLSFDIAYKDTTRTYSQNNNTTISGLTGIIKAIDISPLSMKISFQTDKAMNDEDQVLFDNNWLKAENSMYLVMKDGTKINNLSVTADMQSSMYTINAMFPFVIDLDQIDKLILDQKEIPLKK